MNVNQQHHTPEYRVIVSRVQGAGGDSNLVKALMENADWTQDGAIELLTLARKYGHFLLANATALAEALEIEDGMLNF